MKLEIIVNKSETETSDSKDDKTLTAKSLEKSSATKLYTAPTPMQRGESIARGDSYAPSNSYVAPHIPSMTDKPRDLYQVPLVEKVYTAPIQALPSIDMSAMPYEMPAAIPSTPQLTIRPLGSSSLHIHEEAGGISHIKFRDKSYYELNSYDAAMLDLDLDIAGNKKAFGKPFEQWRIPRTKTNAEIVASCKAMGGGYIIEGGIYKYER
jgi:hypothetical protein